MHAKLVLTWTFLAFSLGATACDSGDGGSGDGGDTDGVDTDGSGDALYAVSTCAFSGQVGNCDPLPADTPRKFFEGEFALVNPRTGPGCAATLSLSVNGGMAGTGRMAWDAHELDATTCAEVGAPIEGSRDLDPVTTQDVYLPIGDFTFRIRVERQ